MSDSREQTQIVICPKVCIPVEHYTAGSQQTEPRLIQSNIPMAWTQDGMDFRLDITLPLQSALEIWFPLDVELLHVNGEIIWKKSEERSLIADGAAVQVHLTGPSGLSLTCNAGGALHILATFAEKGEPRRNEIRKGAN